MKILTVCDQGNNRSVTLAFALKYLGHDVLSCGLKTNSPGTIDLLCEWADTILVTDITQRSQLPVWASKVKLWNLGPDVYPRPHNKELLAACRRLVAANPL